MGAAVSVSLESSPKKQSGEHTSQPSNLQVCAITKMKDAASSKNVHIHVHSSDTTAKRWTDKHSVCLSVCARAHTAGMESCQKPTDIALGPVLRERDST